MNITNEYKKRPYPNTWKDHKGLNRGLPTPHKNTYLTAISTLDIIKEKAIKNSMKPE